MSTIRCLLAAMTLGVLASVPAAAAPASSGGTILGMEPATAVAAGIGVAAGALLVYEVADDDDEQVTGGDGGEPPVTPPPTTTTTTPSTVTTTTTTSTGS